MQRNNITFRPQLQGVKDIKVELIDNVFHVYATRIDKRASHCNHKMQIKDYRTVTILLSSYQNKKVILHLKKQRYKCPHCRKTITSQIEAVDKNNNISKEVKNIILEKLSETKSYKQIAKEEKVSVNTVIRVLEKVVIKRQTSPDTSVIYIDEFKGNIGKEKYQLAMYDKNRKLVDILRNRHSQTTKNIINEFEIQPQVVVMDMWFFVNSGGVKTPLSIAKNLFLLSVALIL